MAFTIVDSSAAGSFSAVYPDIIETYILTRLDGPTLASAASTSSQLRNLCTEQKLWRNISTATWPSIDDPRVRHVISSFPGGYRSFFADSYPFVEKILPPAKYQPSIPSSTELISAVDLYYRGELIYSKVQETETETETETGWLMSSPFGVEILDPKETIPTKIQYPGGNYADWVRQMEDNLSLNWIIIDPTRKRAANISSRAAVSASRNWVTGNLEIRYVTVMEAGVEVAVVVACGAAEEWEEVDEEVGREVHVRHMRLEVKNIEGKCINRKDSLIILQRVMEGKRGKGRKEDLKGEYKEYLIERKRWRERKEKRERAKDMFCLIFGFTLFFAFWGFVLLR